jgi:hypothetical protein
MDRISRRRTLRVTLFALAILSVALTRPWSLLAQGQGPEPAKVRYAQIGQADLKEWLTDLASDAFQGRQAFTEGYGMAAAYVAEHLKQFGVKPVGDGGSYFQVVSRKGYRVTRNSSVTVTLANGQSRTFKHGDHVTFAANVGRKQTIAAEGVEFVGTAPDYTGRNLNGKLAVWVTPPPSATPPAAQPAGGGRGGGRGGPGGGNRAAAALAAGAAAAIGFVPAATASPAETALAQAQAALAQAAEAVTAAQAQLAGRGGAGAGRGGGRGGGPAAAVPPDINPTTMPPDALAVAPQITADETFFEFLFSASPIKFPDLRARLEKGEALPWVPVPGTKVSINLDNTYEAVSAEYSRNVVGIVEGTDPKLKDTYVLFGAHLDHVGVQLAGGGRGRAGGGGAQPPAPPSGPVDLIRNGADDDGSGSTAMLGIAKAFATGVKPKRSVVFVWHTAEESGLLGARYMAEFPVVPLDKIQVQLNMDMIGRSQDDKPENANSVFVVGADRISTDLHNLVVLQNRAQAKPLTLDYELNSPGEVSIPGMQNIYGRSDHFAYAAKGIPIAFFFTGLHADYHGVGDHADKINYPKLTRVAQLVYEVGFSIANTDRVLDRDNKGPRAVKGSPAEIIKK